MRALSMIFLFALGAVLQAVLPVLPWVGGAKVPVLLGLVLFYALSRDRSFALQAALLAGVLQDAMGRIPLGYTASCFVLVAWAVSALKRDVFIYDWSTHVLMGAVAGGFVTLFMYGVLRSADSIYLPVQTALLKTLGSIVLGGVTAPLVFHFSHKLELFLGFGEGGGAHEPQ